jgi:hypothetical protein
MLMCHTTGGIDRVVPSVVLSRSETRRMQEVVTSFTTVMTWLVLGLASIVVVLMGLAAWHLPAHRRCALAGVLGMALVMAHKKRRDLPTRLPGAPWMIWLLLYHIIEREQNAFLHNLVRILVLPQKGTKNTWYNSPKEFRQKKIGRTPLSGERASSDLTRAPSWSFWESWIR